MGGRIATVLFPLPIGIGRGKRKIEKKDNYATAYQRNFPWSGEQKKEKKGETAFSSAQFHFGLGERSCQGGGKTLLHVTSHTTCGETKGKKKAHRGDAVAPPSFHKISPPALPAKRKGKNQKGKKKEKASVFLFNLAIVYAGGRRNDKRGKKGGKKKDPCAPLPRFHNYQQKKKLKEKKRGKHTADPFSHPALASIRNSLWGRVKRKKKGTFVPFAFALATRHQKGGEKR